MSLPLRLRCWQSPSSSDLSNHTKPIEIQFCPAVHQILLCFCIMAVITWYYRTAIALWLSFEVTFWLIGEMQLEAWSTQQHLTRTTCLHQKCTSLMGNCTSISPWTTDLTKIIACMFSKPTIRGNQMELFLICEGNVLSVFTWIWNRVLTILSLIIIEFMFKRKTISPLTAHHYKLRTTSCTLSGQAGLTQHLAESHSGQTCTLLRCWTQPHLLAPEFCYASLLTPGKGQSKKAQKFFGHPIPIERSLCTLLPTPGIRLIVWLYCLWTMEKILLYLATGFSCTTNPCFTKMKSREFMAPAMHPSLPLQVRTINWNHCPSLFRPVLIRIVALLRWEGIMGGVSCNGWNINGHQPHSPYPTIPLELGWNTCVWASIWFRSWSART